MSELQLLQLALHKMLANKEYRADIREMLMDLNEMICALTSPALPRHDGKAQP